MTKKLLFYILYCTISISYVFMLHTQEATSMPWTEFSFILKPSTLGGVGVFATHDISAGTQLFRHEGHTIRKLKIKNVPEELVKYCVYINDEECLCPERFDRMEIGWYINHSNTPNIENRGEVKIDENNGVKPNFYAIKDIKAGDEILIDYNTLNEPEHLKEDYYK